MFTAEFVADLRNKPAGVPYISELMRAVQRRRTEDNVIMEGNLSRTIFTFCANTKKAYSVSTLDGRLKNGIGLMYLSIIALQ